MSSSNSNEKSKEIPEHFICPISMDVMSNPLMSKGGQNYDRQSILQWLRRGNANCPLTRQPLVPSKLVPNNMLKMSIFQWQKEQGILVENEEDRSLDREQAVTEFLGFLSLDAGGHESNQAEDDESGDDMNYLFDLYSEVLEIVDP